MSKEEDFYAKLKIQLSETAEWPSVYLYKFIVPTDAIRISKIQTIFDNLGAVISSKVSKNEKHTSLSVKVSMKNPDAVIEKYKEVAVKVDGVISL